MNRSQHISESLPFAIFLTLSGGFMDAYSYICRGNVFANAQTGNILLMGVNLSMGNFSLAIRYLFPIIAFTLGIAIAEIIRHKFENNERFHWRQCVILSEILILFTVAFIPQSLNLMANSLTSLVCGVQVQSFRRLNGGVYATTMCIGNLRTATHYFCDYCYSKEKSDIKNALLYFIVIVIFALGAVIGNFFVGIYREKAIIISSLILLIGLIYMNFSMKNKS